MILQPAKTTAAAPVAPALPRQTDSKVSQELLAVKSLWTAAFTSHIHSTILMTSTCEQCLCFFACYHLNKVDRMHHWMRYGRQVKVMYSMYILVSPVVAGSCIVFQSSGGSIVRIIGRCFSGRGLGYPRELEVFHPGGSLPKEWNQWQVHQ
jgi:hypothetical protein